jgi:hypothetical protein
MFGPFAFTRARFGAAPLKATVITLPRLALLWQIHLGRGNVSIHVRQCGHRRGGDRMKSELMACRTAGKLG